MSNALKDLRKDRLKKLVDLNDMLSRQLESKDQIKFPKIVICGDQSHGKTSLIENIIEFKLPRGDGTQTRVPFRIQMREGDQLELRLKYTDQDGNIIEKEVQKEDLEEQMREAQRIVTGDETSIKNQVVDLEIKQPDLDTLTIIDLPGYIHFSENVNDQDTTQQILKEMYDFYLKDSDTTICVVVSAASNIQTSSTFALARKHDFVGDRTILCVTKIDQKPDTSFEDFRIKANKNNIDKIFYVRNRTQAEVDGNVNFQEIRKLEKDFINQNKYLSSYPDEQKGLHNMCKCLIELQEKSIIPNLLSNKNNLQNLLIKKKKELDELGVELTNKLNIEEFIINKFDCIYNSIKNQYYEIDDTIENLEFQEIKHIQEDIGKTFSVIYELSGISLEYFIQEENDNYKISFQSNKDCGLEIDAKIKLEDNRIIYNIKELTLKKKKQQSIIIEKGKEFIFKVVHRPPNIFLPYYELRDIFEQDVKERYQIHYFIQENFMNFFKNEQQRIQHQFGLKDRDFTNLAERILKSNILPSIRQSSQNFVQESSQFLLDIWLQKTQKVFLQFPQVSKTIQKLIINEFKPQTKNLNDNLEIDFVTASLFNTCNQMYQILIEIMKQYLEDGTGEDNILLKNYLKNVPTDEIRNTYSQDEKIYYQGIRIWSFWNLTSTRLLDSIVNKVPLFLISYPIKNIQKIIFREISNKNEDELRKLVNSEKKVQQREKKQLEIQTLEETLLMINTDLGDEILDDENFISENEDQETTISEDEIKKQFIYNLNQ